MDRYRPGLVVYLGRLLNDHRDIDEVVNDAFLAAYRRRIDGGPPPDDWRGYLVGTATKQAFTRYRVVRRRMREVIGLNERQLPYYDPDHGYAASEALREFGAAARELLNERERACLVLPLFDVGEDEIAKMFHTTVHNVQTVRARARATMRTALSRPRPVTSRSGSPKE